MTSPASQSPRRRRPRNLLARLAGAQADVLAKAPTDRVKYSAMGGVLLTTAGVAGVSAAFALFTTLHLPVGVAVLAGLLWAVVIVNLDRLLIVNLRRQSGWLRNTCAAVPRIVLAFVIGSIVSVPLVLQIFGSEIASEMQVMHSDNLIAAQTKLNQQFADIDTMQKKADDLQAIASGQSRPSVSADPDVVAAQKRVDETQAAYDKAAGDAQCELVGSCGTGRPGVGKAYEDAKAKADQSKSDLNVAKAQLAGATTAAGNRISGGASSNAESAKAELATLKPRLEERKKARTEAQGRLDRGELGNEGLLARLEALDRLTSGNTQMQLAKMALTALFLLIEVLPVVVKLLSLIGEPTLYDKLLGKEEKTLEKRAGRGADRTEEIEQDLQDQQVEQGKEANKLLVAKQAEIAKDAIETWSRIAKSRSDAELKRWYAAHSGQSASAAASPPPPTIKPTTVTVPITTVPQPPAAATAPTRGQTYGQFKAVAGTPPNTGPRNGSPVHNP